MLHLKKYRRYYLPKYNVKSSVAFMVFHWKTALSLPLIANHDYLHTTISEQSSCNSECMA